MTLALAQPSLAELRERVEATLAVARFHLAAASGGDPDVAAADDETRLFLLERSAAQLLAAHEAVRGACLRAMEERLAASRLARRQATPGQAPPPAGAPASPAS